jgi:phytoene dehydrogenase-like protein
MSKSVIIVGAGISGLSAGCYAQMNGFKTTVFESNKIPGGLCTAWERKGYKFDTSMHMLTGSSTGSFNKIWRELGVVKNFRFFYHDLAMQIEGLNNKLTIVADKKTMENEMLAISPQDGLMIKEFIDLIFGYDLMDTASLKPFELQNSFDRLKTLPYVLPLIPNFLKYKSKTIQDFARQFKNPFLREAVRFFIDAPGWPMPKFPLTLMSGFMKSSVMEAGTPEGGSQKVVLHIANLYEKLGGVIKCENRIANLIIENETVKGVLLEDGTEKRADYVIWAGDGHNLIFDILGGKYIDESIRNMYFRWKPVRPLIQVMIGVNHDLSDEPRRIIFKPDEPVVIAGEEHNWLTILHHCYDKTLAPEGKSIVEVWYDTDFEYWNVLSKHREEYEAEKTRIANYTLAQLEKRWLGFTAQVEVVDIPTPATYFNYTGNWKGSPDGWYITADNWKDNHPARNLPGLDRLYLAGHWTAPFTGTVIAALSGRQITQLICKKEGKRFKTEKIN